MSDRPGDPDPPSELQELDEEVGYEAQRRFSVQEIERGQSGWVMLIRYQPEQAGPFIRVDCWTGDQARGEADEIGEMLEARKDTASRRVRALLPAVRETDPPGSTRIPALDPWGIPGWIRVDPN